MVGRIARPPCQSWRRGGDPEGVINNFDEPDKEILFPLQQHSRYYINNKLPLR